VKDFSPLALTDPAVGFPARIGVITRTDGTIIRFAESDTALTVSGDSFTVIPGLSVSAVKHTANGEMPSCEFVAVHGNGYTFDSTAIDTGLFDGATVQIYIVDRLNLTRKGLLFTGAISTITTDPISHQVNFSVKGPAASARILMTQKRSPMCRTDLFSTLCGLDKTAFDVASSVATIVSPYSFTVTGSLAQATGYFDYGVAVTADGKAFVMGSWNQSTQTITTYGPISRIISVSLGLTLYPGCDKTLGATGCGKFSNYLNFQGEPHFLGTAAAAQQV
jgi:uncharacterized phage protein (TIGR02218 family)